MATVMEFSSPAAEFPLGSVFEKLPDVRIELERVVPQDGLVIPYFWVRGAEISDIEAAFETHEGVANVRLIDSVDEEYLLRAEWEEAYVGLLRALASADVSLLSGIGTNDGWEFEVRGETRAAISEFRSNCRRQDLDISITAVHALTPLQGDNCELTESQREALLLAFDRGYFDSPRTTNLSAVAEELGITQQSLSSRLRRGHRRLIAQTLSSS